MTKDLIKYNNSFESYSNEIIRQNKFQRFRKKKEHIQKYDYWSRPSSNFYIDINPSMLSYSLKFQNKEDYLASSYLKEPQRVDMKRQKNKPDYPYSYKEY